MKIPREAWILSAGSVISAGVIVSAIVWGLNHDSGAVPVAGSATHSVNVTASAAHGTVVTGRDGVTRLVMRGVPPTVEMADVSPGHERLRVPTWIWHQMWSRLYGTVEPNATLSWGQGASHQQTSVALAGGSYRPGYLAFTLRPLSVGATAPLPLTGARQRGRVSSLGQVDLYVDPPASGAQGLVQQIDSTLAGMQVLANTPVSIQRYGTTDINDMNGGAYSGVQFPKGYPPATSPEQGRVALYMYSGAAVAQGDFSGRYVKLSGSGGAFEHMVVGTGTLDVTGLYDGALTKLNLTGGKLVGGGPMSDANVSTGSNLFLDANFSGATLDGPSFRGAVFASPNLDGATFNVSNLAADAFDGTVFLGTDFAGLNVPQPEGTDHGAGEVWTIDELSLRGVTIAPLIQEVSGGGGGEPVLSSFAGMDLGPGVTFASGSAPSQLIQVQFTDANLGGTNFGGATLSNCDFAGATLSMGAHGLGTPLGTNFVGSTISGGSFNGATISAADFDSANISNVNLGEATFNVTADPDGGKPSVAFDGATLTTVAFLSNSTIENASFQGANLTDVHFAINNGVGSPPEFVATLLSQVNSATGLAINNAEYAKQNGAIYQVLTDGPSAGQWQPLTVEGGLLVPNGDPVPAGGDGNVAPNNGGGNVDPNNGGGGNVDPNNGGNVDPNNVPPDNNNVPPDNNGTNVDPEDFGG